jgi:hypothetical protein
MIWVIRLHLVKPHCDKLNSVPDDLLPCRAPFGTRHADEEWWRVHFFSSERLWLFSTNKRTAREQNHHVVKVAGMTSFLETAPKETPRPFGEGRSHHSSLPSPDNSITFSY